MGSVGAKPAAPRKRFWPREALALAPPVEDGPRLEAGRTARALWGQSALVQSLRAARGTRSLVDLQDPRRCRQLSLGVARGVAVAAAPGNGEARRHVGQALRWHRRLLRSCGPLWGGRIAEHDDQRRHSPRAWHERRNDVVTQAEVGDRATLTILEGSR